VASKANNEYDVKKVNGVVLNVANQTVVVYIIFTFSTTARSFFTSSLHLQIICFEQKASTRANLATGDVKNHPTYRGTSSFSDVFWHKRGQMFLRLFVTLRSAVLKQDFIPIAKIEIMNEGTSTTSDACSAFLTLPTLRPEP